MPDHTQLRRATAWMRTTAVADVGTVLSAAAPDDTSGHSPSEPDIADDGCGPGSTALEPGSLYRRISGKDDRAQPVSEEELAALGDPMAVGFFRVGVFPTTVQELLSGLPATAAASRKVYLVSEAGQIPPDAIGERDMRFVITTAVGGSQVDLLVSTQAGGDPEEGFLQVAAWDPGRRVFNFYARFGSSWVWAGNSWHALEPDSRGKGCFDSHVNGSVVMKELRIPWNNWQSERATIRLAEDDPLRQDPLFQQTIGAERLELTVRSLITRWTAARLAAVTANGVVDHPDRLLRHLFTSTTVNLTSTDRQSSNVTADSPELTLPTGFWLNQDVLFDDLRLSTQSAPPRAPAARYLAGLTRFGFRLEERFSAFSQPGDTFFAFVVPEAAHEDNEVVRQMVRTGLISAKFAACVLMVDFPNPVFSPARSLLMQYVPTTPTKAAELCDKVAQAILDATRTRNLPADSPEGRFAAHWQVPDDAWRTVFGQRVDAYLHKVTQQIQTASGFDDYVRLAESRRRQFRLMKLNEFELTLPVTNIPPGAPPLAMREDATVADTSKENAMATLDAYGPPGNLDDLDDFGRKAWNSFISDTVDEAIQGPDPQQVLNDSPRPQFYNLTSTDTAADSQHASITWTAFPRIIKITSVGDLQRWQRADASRDVQDEYCEWSVTRDGSGKITQVTFTCEGPEYWEILAQTNPDKVFELYQRFISPDVRKEDLFSPSGRYQPRNKWNNSTSHGAMHLIQPNNTLGAEIELAAAATIRRVINGQELTTEQELIGCSKYGAAERNSDPHIGAGVNALARQKADISLADPVGLYFDDLSTDGWETPDGSDPKSYWTYVRGDSEHRVRAVYEVPPDKGFSVGDITIGGKPIDFGAQIADFITIRLIGVACRFGGSTAQPQTACKEFPAVDMREEGFNAAAFSASGRFLDPRPTLTHRSSRVT